MPNILSEAIAHFQHQRFRAAEKSCRSALKRNPNSADAHHLMGILKSRKGEAGTSVRHLEKSVSLSPQNIEARYNLGKGYRDLGRNEEAISHFDMVLKSWETRPDVWVEMAIVLGRANRLPESVEAFRRALELGATAPEVHTELARTLIDLYDFDAAETALEHALSQNPDFNPAKINLAILKDNQGQIDQSISIYDSVLLSNPHYHEASYRRALALLARERLSDGWKSYKERHTWGTTTTSHSQIDAPMWSGEDVAHKAMLVWTEQGPGDEILLGSMIEELALLACQLTLACSPRLEPVFTRSFPGLKIVSMTNGRLPKKAIGHVDVQASLTEIGAALRPQIDSFREPNAFLKVDKDLSKALRQKYKSDIGNQPLIGISWRSSNKDASSQKSTDLAQWAPLLEKHDARFVNLQYGDTASERESLVAQTGIDLIHDPEIDPINDIDGFISQVASMDLVISTSNTTVHAAGGSGTECWTLVPQGTGRPWYWFLDRSNSLWYPSMRLYRQSQAGNWATPLSAVLEDLAQWMQQWHSPT